jgi:polyisoprenoid-binding protein YceI
MNAYPYVLGALTLATALSSATPFRFDASNSSLEFIGSYEDAPVEGSFKKFSGTVDIQSLAKATISFNVEIDVASLDSQYPDRDEVLRSSDWFDSKQFAKARFVSGACPLTATTCAGQLEIKGKKKQVLLKINYLAKTSTVTGSAVLNRRDFGIGSGEWDEAGVIGSKVDIRFRLKLAAPKKQ